MDETILNDPQEIVESFMMNTFWTRNWSPNAANILVLVARGRRSLKKP